MQNINDLQNFISTHLWIVVILTIWTYAWKGTALWKAGKNNQPIWFVALLVLNTFGLLEIIYIFGFGKRKDLNNCTACNGSCECKKETEQDNKEVKQENPALSNKEPENTEITQTTSAESPIKTEEGLILNKEVSENTNNVDTVVEMEANKELKETSE